MALVKLAGDLIQQHEVATEVEDYRVSLNLRHKGKYILPNAVSHQGDFCKPNLLEEGINIMEKMLKDESNKRVSNLCNDVEIDRLMVANALFERLKKYNWHPGEQSMSQMDIERNFEKIEDMKIEEYLMEVAATSEEDDDKILG